MVILTILLLQVWLHVLVTSVSLPRRLNYLGPKKADEFLSTSCAAMSPVVMWDPRRAAASVFNLVGPTIRSGGGLCRVSVSWLLYNAATIPLVAKAFL